MKSEHDAEPDIALDQVWVRSPNSTRPTGAIRHPLRGCMKSDVTSNVTTDIGPRQHPDFTPDEIPIPEGVPEWEHTFLGWHEIGRGVPVHFRMKSKKA